MKLIDRTVKVPTISEPAERGRDGELINAVKAQFGRAALEVGTPDHGRNGGGTDGTRTDAVDTVANILHWLHDRGIDPAPVLESASRHYLAEIFTQTAESRAVDILKDAGMDAHLQHTGGGVMVAEVLSTTIPGRTVWVTDSEDRDGGPFLVGAYPELWGQEWIEELSGPCTAENLPAKVRRGLTHQVSER